MSRSPKSIFEDIQKKLKENAAAAAEPGGNSAFKNENVFKPTKAGTMTVRLLWLPPAEGVKRDFPMINSYVHRFYNPNAANGHKYVKVACPTSQYMKGETMEGFGDCCICKAVSKFYKEGADSPSAKELYNTFRRACEGYIPVYVVTGPEELQGKVKILQYGKQFKDFFNRKIFGITAKGDETPVEADEIIGLEAFMYYDNDEDAIQTVGYDLIISTTIENIPMGNRKVAMPKYSLDFSRRPKTIEEIDGINLNKASGVKYFKNLNDELGFDKSFLIESTAEERENFLNTYVIKDEETKAAPKIDELVDDEEVDEEVEVKPKKTAKKKVVEEDDDDYVDVKGNVEDVDVDKLLADIG